MPAEVARRSDARMEALTDHLGPAAVRQILQAMDTIHGLLNRRDAE